MLKLWITKLNSATIFAVSLMCIAGFTGTANAQGGGECPDGTPPPCHGSDVDYGDLIYLHRDGSGVPILDGNLCQQPIAFPTSDNCSLDCTGQDPCLVPVDPLTCAVAVEYAGCTHEVEFGRMNAARSPPRVFESQLEDVVVKLATADCITLDPAGRLVASVVDDELGVLTSAIDSPLQNMAIYRQLMLAGFIGDEANPIALPADMMLTAARGLGVAADKTGEVNVDVVAYLNMIMGLTAPDAVSVLPRICIGVKEEVMGNVELVEKCFLDYGDVPGFGAQAHRRGPAFTAFADSRAQYAYGRDENFGALPAPAYIPSNQPTDGWFEHLALVFGSSDPYYFEVVQGPILGHVFNGAAGFTGGNIGGFAQAADDTRAVINFMHNWPTPLDYETSVPCTASGDIGYDLSISEESGLQVPRKMAVPTEGREFTVTVSNAGPDAATGLVRVTAVPAAGGPVLDEDGNGSPFVFPFVDLAAGASASTTTIFTVGEPYERTTITWTATVEAPHDVNALNNSVTKYTSVSPTNAPPISTR